MEVEIKAKCPEKEFPVIRGKLLALGAVKKKEKHQIDHYYNPPHADWSKEKRYIRVREEGENTIFAYHETPAASLANEFETKIENKKVFEQALERMGFQKLGLIDKNRETFQLGEFEICLDNVKNIGTFVEIETDGNPQNLSEKHQACLELLEKIGLDESALTAERLAEIATRQKANEKSEKALGARFEELLFIIRTIINEERRIAPDSNKFEKQHQYIEDEVKELKEALQENDTEHINEEIGHVLYDTLMLAVLGEKNGKISLENVFKELNWSMKFRHPHAFEGTKTNSLDDIKRLKKDRKDAYHQMKKQTGKGYE